MNIYYIFIYELFIYSYETTLSTIAISRRRKKERRTENKKEKI
jgi:hypothetical protein